MVTENPALVVEKQLSRGSGGSLIVTANCVVEVEGKQSHGGLLPSLSGSRDPS
jgi:hypothetical protein